MIFDVPTVKVSGVTYQVYAVDFSWGGADSPSKLTVDFINKSGIYKTPILGTSTPATIKIGDCFEFVGFPVSWSQSNSVAGKTMTVSYLDTSVLLDRTFVGLKGLHGAAPANLNGVDLDGTIVEGSFNQKQMLLVGSYVDPCEGVTEDYLDPCNPCLQQTDFTSLGEQNADKMIQCEKARFLDILDVHYTFLDLITGLRSKGIQFHSIPTIKNEYYGRYTGSARDVLKSWCSDLGFTFYWENGAVKFVDLRKGITINDTNFYTDCKLLSTSESQSIEGNTAVGNIIYFGAPGRIEDYNCNQTSYKLSLIPITLKDLFADVNGNVNPYIRKYYSRSNANNVAGLQAAVVLSKYSPVVRDMTLLYSYYNVTEAAAIAPGTQFPLLGMTVKSVYDVDDEAAEAPGANGKELFWNWVPESLRKRISHVGGAIAVIEYNPEQREKFLEFEQNLANEFFGRYWISYFSKGDQFSYSGPDGTPEYFDAGTPQTLPFTKLVPNSIAESSAFLQNIINNSAALNKDSGHVGDVTTANPNSYAHSFLLMDRDAAWEPTENSDQMRLLEKNLSDIYFYNLEPFKEEGSGDVLKANEYYVIICNKPTLFEFTTDDPVSHPTEKFHKNRTVEVNSYQTTYGLRSDLCKPYRFQLKIRGGANQPAVNQSFTVYPPVQSYDTYGVDFAGYTIVATQDSSTETSTKVFIPRKEYILGDVPMQNDESVALSINFKDISSTVQSIMEEVGGSCGYSTAQIRSIANEFKVAVSRPKQVTQVSKTYSLAGFPTRQMLIEDGLSGLSIRYDSARGISTEVQFNNTPPITKSENVIDQEVQTNLLKRFLGKRFLNSQNRVEL